MAKQCEYFNFLKISEEEKKVCEEFISLLDRPWIMNFDFTTHRLQHEQKQYISFNSAAIIFRQLIAADTDKNEWTTKLLQVASAEYKKNLDSESWCSFFLLNFFCIVTHEGYQETMNQLRPVLIQSLTELYSDIMTEDREYRLNELDIALARMYARARKEKIVPEFHPDFKMYYQEAYAQVLALRLNEELPLKEKSGHKQKI